jgi:hypothetical protein
MSAMLKATREHETIMGTYKCKIWNESIAGQSLPDRLIRIRSHRHKTAAIV